MEEMFRSYRNNDSKLLKEVANYYLANIGKQYLPEIRSTKAFREKFEKLVSHKQRNK